MGKTPISCPLHMPVHVIQYLRFRLGKWESVCEHCRSQRRR